MSNTDTLLDRNRAFAGEFAAGDLPILPKLGAVVITCSDSRVDPAHVLGLELGDALVIRNVGGRVTPEVVDEIATLAFMARRAAGAAGAACVPVELVLMQHSDCGAERLASPKMQHAIRERLGIDVSSMAIADHETSLRDDLERLRRVPQVPRDLVVSGFIYDVHDGRVREVFPPAPLGQTPETPRTERTTA